MAGKTTKKKAASKLHYDKAALLQDYTLTFGVVMKGAAVLAGIILTYFLLNAVYLGSLGHTKGTPFVKEFGDRIDYEYNGKKVPLYDNGE